MGILPTTITALPTFWEWPQEHVASVSEISVEFSQTESPALVPSQALQAKPGLATTPALGFPPVPGQLPLGILLMHLSGASLESRKLHRTQLRLGGHTHVLCPVKTKWGFPWAPRAQGSFAGWLSLPSTHPRPLATLSRSGDLDSGPLVGGELPGTVQ